MMIKTIDQADVAGKRVLMRVDFNVPVDEHGRITDDRRIRLALPSIQSVLRRGGRLVLISHFGRPEGKGIEPSESLRPVFERLRELLPGVNCVFPGDECTGPASAAAVRNLRDGQLVLLENLRFDAGEKKGDAGFAAKLEGYGDIYCNEAFGASHRDDASLVALPREMFDRPRVAGLLLQKELNYLSHAIANAKKPFVAVLGGAKVSDKLGAIANLTGKVSTILVGGAMAYTFLKARGQDVGSSLVQEAMLGKARDILAAAAAGGTQLLLPEDHVCGKEISSTTPAQVFASSIPQGWMGLDIGPATQRTYASALMSAKTIVWNGPMGVFETPPFDAGTRSVAQAIVKATSEGGGAGAVSIVGGGDSAAAVEAFGLADKFSHVSTGGGASLEMLEGKKFNSLAALEKA